MKHTGGSRGPDGQGELGRTFNGSIIKEGKGPWVPEQPGRLSGHYVYLLS